jgi:hypothetical protein
MQQLLRTWLRCVLITSHLGVKNTFSILCLSEWAGIPKHAKLYGSHYGINSASVVILCQSYVLRFGRYIFLLQVAKWRHKASPSAWFFPLDFQFRVLFSSCTNTYF